MDDLRRRLWGRNIRNGRRAIGMSQGALAVALGITQQAISDWERGKTAPRDTARQQLATLLHQDVWVLFPLNREAA